MSERDARPGKTWRVGARDEGDRPIAVPVTPVFDELVVDPWLHAEWMDERRWWLRVGDARIHGEHRADVEPAVAGVRYRVH
jgi:hypothetical protein